jgi:demethylmenaquinone methyltransferase/2-methoxy-6-polyprenyl-1,4-benzoquinol methylase
MTRAQLDKRPGDVAAMFDGLAGRYDLLNDILSAGQDRYWRRVVARAVAAGPGERVLDLAAGTGTSSVSFTSAGALCIACDFSLGMLRAGKLRAPDKNSSVTFVAGDALALPFADAQFDAVTISFGLRNTADPGQALAEMLRVTRPGGRLVVCEFSHLAVPALDRVYHRALHASGPALARVLAQDPGAYAYLAETIAAWPDQRALARMIGVAGWTGIAWRNLSLGVVAVHRASRGAGARRPAPAPESPQEV